MKAGAAVERIRKSVATIGLASTLHDLALKTANRVVVVKILKGMTAERVDPAYATCPEPYRPVFLDEKRLRQLGRDPANGLPESFLNEALAEGDECFGLLAGGALAAYGWYSRRPTPIDPPDLVLDPGNHYVYMYKGFTHPTHRGKRLHAIGMTLALQHYQRRGYRGLISYVESNNFSSLNSVRRMGYEIFGSVWALRVFGMHLTHAGAGWKQHGARIEPAERGPVTRAGALAGAARR